MVLAAEGSAPAGELEPLPQPPGAIDEAGRAAVHAELRRRLALAIWRVRPDVVHFHGIDFHRYLPRTGPLALVTLHLPLDWYPPRALAPERPATWLIPVSRDQARRAPAGARLSAPIENGVDLAAFRPARKRRYAVALGRICPEKGFHHALEAARAAGLPLLLAGSVFLYTDHERYFEGEIRPRLDRWRRWRRWIGPVTGAAKRRLIATAAGRPRPRRICRARGRAGSPSGGRPRRPPAAGSAPACEGLLGRAPPGGRAPGLRPP